MKTAISLHQPSQASILNRISAWLSSSNHWFSSLMEEDITNRQLLLIIHMMLVTAILFSTFFIQPWAAIVLVAWFAWSVKLVKKGGIK